MEEGKGGLEKKVIKKQEVEKPKIEDAIDKIIDKQSVIEGIFEQTEDLTLRQLKNKRKNRREIVDLIGGTQVDLSVLALDIQNHPSQFPQELYNEVYRVFQISGDPTVWRKDKRVADFTNEFLYSSRYERNVLPALREKNKYDPDKYCTRYNKHYQHFTNEGITRLKTYLRETMDVLKDCEEEYEFRKKMFEQYNVPLQKDLFKD